MANQEGRLDQDINEYDDEVVDLGVSPEESEDTGSKGYDDYVNQEADQGTVDTTEEDDLPDKYRGKAVKDIVAMHQNAEKLVGKQSQEVGELRRIVDDFIQAQTLNNNNQAQEPVADIDDIDFFEDPKRAVAQLLDNHPSVKQSKQLVAHLAKQEAVATLKANHPDYQQIVTDNGFVEWVGKSKIRTELLRKADQAYDAESANELFSLWKERQGMVNDTLVQEKRARKQSVRSGSTGNVKGSSERSGRKIYRRADIVELMTKDPERYQSLASEIRQAYAEGRVR